MDFRRLVIWCGVLAGCMIFCGCQNNNAQKKAETVRDPGPGTEAIAAAVQKTPDQIASFDSPLTAADENTSRPKTVRLDDGTTYVDDVEGTGTEVKVGMKATVNYTGRLLDGKEFDSNMKEGGQPFVVDPLGMAPVIDGWNRGIVGMKEGGKRRLTIPYQSAYGEQGSPPVIPPKATLVFDVELLKAEKSDRPTQPQGGQMVMPQNVQVR